MHRRWSILSSTCTTWFEMLVRSDQLSLASFIRFSTISCENKNPLISKSMLIIDLSRMQLGWQVKISPF